MSTRNPCIENTRRLATPPIQQPCKLHNIHMFDPWLLIGGTPTVACRNTKYGHADLNNKRSEQSRRYMQMGTKMDLMACTLQLHFPNPLPTSTDHVCLCAPCVADIQLMMSHRHGTL